MKKVEQKKGQNKIQLYPLPDGWVWETVGSVGGGKKNAIVDGPFGSNLKVSDYVAAGPVPVLTTKNLEGDYSKVRYITAEKFEELKRSAVHPSDILVAKIGSCGKLGIYPIGAPTAMIPANLLKVTVADGYDLKYVYHYFSSPFFKSCLDTIVKATAQPAFGVTDFKQLPFPLAPLDVQKGIVAEIEKQLSRFDEAVTALKRIQANLKRYKAAVLKAAVEGTLTDQWRKEHPDVESADQLLKRILAERRAKWEAEELAKMKAKGINPKDDSWKKKYKEPAGPDTADLPELPEGWVWASAEQCSSLITDGEHITPQRTDQGIFLLSARNVHDGALDLENVDYVSEELYLKLSQRFMPEPGDVLLSCSGSVGRSCVVPNDIKFSLVRSVAILKPVLGLGKYMSLCMRSPFLQSQIEEGKTQTAQANIFQGKIKALMLPMPSLRESIVLVQEIERRFSVTEELEATIETGLKRTERLRQALLQQAFAGEISL